MTYTLFAIPNCDTVKKARLFLEKHKIDYTFIDFKKSPPQKADIKRWEHFFGQLPANTKGPTFRKIRDEYEKSSVSKKIDLLISNNSAIKRPILEKNGITLSIGFDEDIYKKIFKIK